MVPNQTLWTFGVPWGLSGTINSCFGVSRAKKLVILVLMKSTCSCRSSFPRSPPELIFQFFWVNICQTTPENAKKCHPGSSQPFRPPRVGLPMVKISLAKKLDILALMKSTCLCPLPSAPKWIFQFFWVDICLTIPENAKKMSSRIVPAFQTTKSGPVQWSKSQCFICLLTKF